MVKYLLLEEPMGFPDRLDVKCESKKEIMETQVFGLNNWRNGDVILWQEEDSGRSMFLLLVFVCFSSVGELIGSRRRSWFLLGTC